MEIVSKLSNLRGVKLLTQGLKECIHIASGRRTVFAQQVHVTFLGVRWCTVIRNFGRHAR